MDHVVSIHHELRNGIANLSLIAMREKELRDLTSLRNYNPHLTIEDYDGHLRRIADLTSKAIRLATTDVHDETLVYPFMTIMMPVVMMADWIGNRDDMIHTFLEAIAPAIKHVASNGTVPTRAIIEVPGQAARGQCTVRSPGPPSRSGFSGAPSLPEEVAVPYAGNGYITRGDSTDWDRLDDDLLGFWSSQGDGPRRGEDPAKHRFRGTPPP